MAFDSPVFIKWFEDGQLIENEQIMVTTNGLAMLNYIPDSFYKVTMSDTNLVEIKQQNPITNINQFKVNYQNGTITFDSSRIGQSVMIRKYTALGVIYTSASRIFDNSNGLPVNTSDVQTLQDYINSIKPYGYKGDFNIATTYEVDSMVSYNYTLYRAKQLSVGILPTNTTYFQSMISIKTEAEYAIEKGDYAKENGDYAKSEGDTAKQKADSILLFSEDWTPESITIDNDIAPLVQAEFNSVNSQLADLTTSIAGNLSQTIQATRDLSIEGTQTITTIGGKTPKSILVETAVNASKMGSSGRWGTGGQCCKFIIGNNGNFSLDGSNAITITSDGSNFTVGQITSVLSGSFIITWSKIGTGAIGTLSMQFTV